MTQATVREWDPERGGSAYLADGSRVVLPPDCLRDSVFRFLRVGQRVQLVMNGDTVARVDLP